MAYKLLCSTTIFVRKLSGSKFRNIDRGLSMSISELGPTSSVNWELAYISGICVHLVHSNVLSSIFALRLLLVFLDICSISGFFYSVITISASLVLLLLYSKSFSKKLQFLVFDEGS